MENLRLLQKQINKQTITAKTFDYTVECYCCEGDGSLKQWEGKVVPSNQDGMMDDGDDGGGGAGEEERKWQGVPGRMGK